MAWHLFVSRVTDSANRLLEDHDFTYLYDANGNLETKTAKAGGAVTTYSYDAEDRLVLIDFPDLTTATYRYDGLARRIEKDVAGVITRYVYDREDILLEYDGTNALLARYTHGPGFDEPLVMERDLDASGTFEAAERFVYHTDGSGSVTELTDSTGVVARAYAYDAYGGIADEVGTLANPYAYTGREFDAESGLYFYRARYYDAQAGRFLTEDPIGFAAGDVNLYRYVGNNPLNFIDPSGLHQACPRHEHPDNNNDKDKCKKFLKTFAFGMFLLCRFLTVDQEGAPESGPLRKNIRPGQRSTNDIKRCRDKTKAKIPLAITVNKRNYKVVDLEISL